MSPHIRLIVCLIGIATIWLSASPSVAAGEPMRIWVDSTGRYSVTAALVRREGDLVILRRKDGGQSSMPVDRISTRDVEYLAEYDKRQSELAAESPVLKSAVIDYPPQPRLDLPRAGFVAAENSVLQNGVVTETTAHLERLPTIQADPNPDTIELPIATLRIDRVHAYDRCSDLVSVGTAGDPAVGMSVTVGFALPGSNMINRVVKFDFANHRSKTIYESTEPVTLLDHHAHSKRSLVLVGHRPSGQGGRLAIATGWRSDEFALNYQRSLPGEPEVESREERLFAPSPPHLRWAKWIDEEHVVAIVDRSLMGWNLVSGEMYFRIDDIDPGSVPALSGGRRHLAVPVSGGVLLVDTDRGKVMGRIAGEPRIVPAVSFSHEGHALAISSQRRLIVWDLVNATKTVQIDSKRSLGSDAPTWIDSDLMLTSSGILISAQREAPLWRYHLNDTRVLSADGRVALFRKRPEMSLTVVEMPHQGAVEAIEFIDAHDGVTKDPWDLPGRSVWNAAGWNDRDVRIGAQSDTLRK